MDYILIQSAACDGGLQIATLDGEEPDAVARRYGACVADYGPYTRQEAEAERDRLLASGECEF